MILVTGGAGFIGSNFITSWLQERDEPIVNLDKLTEAGNLENLECVFQDSRHIFVQGSVCDAGLVNEVISKHKPRAIVHFAAESHVDRSIHDPESFVRTNVNGTYGLLSAASDYQRSSISAGEKARFRFLHVSTDEVFGSLGRSDPPFTELSNYRPNSPYSASKAASDHLVRAWHHTFGLPTLTSNCSNNYGPYQFPEKLIPLMIVNALAERDLPIYGDGLQIRDWLYVEDHCRALRAILDSGTPGGTYTIGGDNERTNIEIVLAICGFLDEARPRKSGRPYKDLIVHVADRPGHDRRYAIDSTKLKGEIGWQPLESFESGIRKTVTWYLENGAWIDHVQNGSYAKWIETNYGGRS